jgi:hypothetical protein
MNMKPIGNLETGLGLSFVILILIMFVVSLLGDKTTTGDVAQSAATILAAVFAASVVGWQIARAKEQAREDQQSRLKLEIYQTITPKIDEASKKIGTLHSKASYFLTEIELHEITDGGATPKTTYETLTFAHEEYFKSISAITVAIEDWGFIDKRFELFRVALACARHDVDHTRQKYLHTAMPYLNLTAVSAAQNLNGYAPPSSEIRSRLEALSSSLTHACLDLIGYLIDFRSEMQRLLVGHLFPDGDHDTRMPKDASVVVLRLENYSEQLNHFYMNHPLGQRMRSERQH